MAVHDFAAACHGVFLITLWRESTDAPWRAALRATGSQERIGFADLEALALFLLRLDEPPAPAAPDDAGGGCRRCNQRG